MIEFVNVWVYMLNYNKVLLYKTRREFLAMINLIGNPRMWIDCLIVFEFVGLLFINEEVSKEWVNCRFEIFRVNILCVFNER
jgi:hypothetical protein